MPKVFIRLGKVASAMFVHTVAALLALFSIWLVQTAYRHLYQGEGEILFGRFPLAYMFQLMDVSVFLVLIFQASRELWDAFKDEES